MQTTKKFRPRFTRSEPPAIQITERDIDIIRRVHKHRFLRAPQLNALCEGSDIKITRRLGHLYHAGYLDRPRAQLTYFSIEKNRPLVYGLANKGAALLAERDGVAPGRLDWHWKNKSVGQLFIEHTLAIADVMVALEMACRNRSDVELLEQQEILAKVKTKAGKVPPFKAIAGTNGKDIPLSLVPDQVFGLAFPKTQRGAYFFLEADRGTMPVVRSDLKQTSILRKLMTYYAGWKAKEHTSQYGWQNFRVLTVTNSAERVENMVAAVKDMTDGRGSGIFLFAEAERLAEGDILDCVWVNGRGEEVRIVA